MTDEPTGASGTMSSSRLAQFEDEVAKLKVTGGGANPERLGSQWGIGLTILGFVIAIISWWSALDAKDNAITITALREIFALIGVGIAVVGIVIWLRNSLTRYLRYWIIRLVYEQREQTEQLDRTRCATRSSATGSVPLADRDVEDGRASRPRAVERSASPRRASDTSPWRGSLRRSSGSDSGRRVRDSPAPWCRRGDELGRDVRER